MRTSTSTRTNDRGGPLRRLLAGLGGGAIAESQEFGELTLAGAGGIAIPVGATAITSQPGTAYQITTGYLVPVGNMTAGGAGQTGNVVFDNGTTWTISTIANAYSVKDGELAAVLALGSATIDGKTVYGRPAADIANTNHTSLVVAETLLFTTGLTIRSHDANDPCFIQRIQFEHDGPVTLRDLTIRDTFQRGTDPYHGAVYLVGFDVPAATKRSTLTIDNCDIYGDDILATQSSDFRTFEGLTAYTGDGAGGGNNAIISLVGFSGDLTTLFYPNHAQFRFDDANSPTYITAVNNASSPKTITLTEALTAVSSAGAKAWSVSNMGVLTGIGTASMTLYPNLTVTNSRISELHAGILGTYQNLTVEDNHFDGFYSDAMQFAPRTGYGTWNINRNTIEGFHAGDTDTLAPHNDVIQFNTLAVTGAGNNLINVIGNGMKTSSTDRAVAVQFIFVENHPGGAAEADYIIEHNYCLGGNSHGISLERPSAATKIRFNTILGNTALHAEGSYLQPAINMIDEMGAADVSHNVVAGISSTLATLYNNHEFGMAEANNEDADYAAQFAGTTFDGADYATFALLRAALVPDAGGDLFQETNAYNIGAVGYYDFSNGTTSYPTAAVAAAPGTGDWSVADTEAGGTVQVLTTAYPALNYGVPVRWEYKVDAGAWTDAGIGTLVGFEITGLTDDVEVDIALRLVTEIGNGTASATKAVTPTLGAYSAASADFNGSTDGYRATSGVSWGNSKIGICSVWMRMDTTWTGALSIIEGLTAGGSPRIYLRTSGSGRMSFALINSAGTTIGSRTLATSRLSVDTWYHMLIAWDLASTKLDWYISAAGTVNNTAESSWLVGPTTTNDTVEACERVGIGEYPTTGDNFDGMLADLYVTTTETLDMTVEANRRKFIDASGKPVDLGSDGSVPTGTAPEFYFSRTWANNLGSEGALTVDGGGPTVPGASSPSD